MNEKLTSQLIIMISGAVALLTGIVMLSIQFLHDLNAGANSHTSMSYFGFTVLTIGAALEALGYVATIPWRAAKP